MNAEQLPLRDIHLPDPVSWWPPAPGWWWLGGLTLLLLLAAWLTVILRNRGRLRREALSALAEISQRHTGSGDGHELCQSLSTLLRRVSLSLYPRSQVASLTGQEWLEFLQGNLPDDPAQSFIRGPGRVLAEAPYNPGAEVDAHRLLEICRRWITANTQQRAAL